MAAGPPWEGGGGVEAEEAVMSSAVVEVADSGGARMGGTAGIHAGAGAGPGPVTITGLVEPEKADSIFH
jgi:hypothetical protein